MTFFNRKIIYWGLVLFIPFFFLIVLEGALQTYRNFLGMGGVFTPSLCCEYKNKSNFDVFPYITDEEGFRKTPYNFKDISREKVYKIVTMGDSITFGATNTPLLHYPGYLEYLLNDTRLKPRFSGNSMNFEVMNAGVIGYTSAHLLNFLKTFVLKQNPDMVIISIGANDLNRFFRFSELNAFRNFPFFYWYYNLSATMGYFRKGLSAITSRLKENSVRTQSKTLEIDKMIDRNNEALIIYEKNLREAISLLKAKGVIPILMPWSVVPFESKLSEFDWDEIEFQDKNLPIVYRFFSEVMEKLSKELGVYFIKTPLQTPIVPKKRDAQFLMTSGIHLNDAGSKIIAYSLAKSINGILEEKSSETITRSSEAEIDRSSILDAYAEIMLDIESKTTSKIQGLIEIAAGRKAYFYLTERKKGKLFSGFSPRSFSFFDAFFALPDAALYAMQRNNNILARHYLDLSIELFPKFSYPYFVFGIYFSNNHENELAQKYFKIASELSPHFKYPLKYLEN